MVQIKPSFTTKFLILERSNKEPNLLFNEQHLQLPLFIQMRFATSQGDERREGGETHRNVPMTVSPKQKLLHGFVSFFLPTFLHHFAQPCPLFLFPSNKFLSLYMHFENCSSSVFIAWLTSSPYLPRISCLIW